jgi:hypothetical protein
MNTDYVITVIGNTDFSVSVYKNLLKTYQDKDVLGRKIRVKQVNTVSELENSDIIFYSEKDNLNIKELNKKIGDYPTIHTGYKVGHEEYMINFMDINDKLSFNVLQENLDAKKLKPSDAILKMSAKK